MNIRVGWTFMSTEQFPNPRLGGHKCPPYSNTGHPGLDPGSILISTPPTQKWIPDRATLVRNDVVLL